MTLHGRSLVAGSLGAEGGTTFRASDPMSGDALEPAFFEATRTEAAQAVDAAAAAFDEYSRLPGTDRARFLASVADRIEDLGDALVERAMAETGLPEGRIVGERGRTCSQLRLFADLVREGSWVDARIDTALPDRKPAPRPDIRRMLRPIGPVIVFGASNFPLAFSTAGGDTASAFAAGCTVVVKAHPAHPGTSELVGSAIASAAEASGLPAGVFSLVHGGAGTGIALVTHPATAAVGFTGSHQAGRALFDAANRRPQPIPVFAEMSSVNPVFVLPGALAAGSGRFAAELLASVTLGVGQFCTKPGLVFIEHGADADSFIEELRTGTAAAGEGTMLTAGIRAAFEAARDRIGACSGVEQLARAEQPAPQGAATAAAPSVAVTDASTFLSSPELATEAFGPFTLVVVTDGPRQMLDCARYLDGQLTATIHGTDADLAAATDLIAAAQRSAGRLIVNGFPTGVEVSPAMHHGGPYPATTDVRFTSVGTAAILRFARPVCYQGFPESLLPAELRDANETGILRAVNGKPTRAPL